jgi:biopolymer transport protein ExbD
MAPLIDVVFLMLIFFVLTTDLVAEPGAVSVELAGMETAQQQQGDYLVITLTEMGEIWFEGRVIEEGPLVSALGARLEDGWSQQVLIHAHRYVPLERALALMDQLQLAGLREISIAVQREMD